MSPDGVLVLFEVTDDHTLLTGTIPLQPEQEGIFVVRSDGSGVRRLAPASRDVAFRIFGDSSGVSVKTDGFFRFSLDGLTVVYTDLGPGPAREEAIQIFTLDLRTGERKQLTRLPTALAIDPAQPVTGFPSFVNDRTVVFFTHGNPQDLNPSGDFRAFTVQTDGTRLRAVAAPVALSGSHVVPTFAVTSGGTNVLEFYLPGTPVNDAPGYISLINEVFLLDGHNLLQLTNFRRVDTGSQFVEVDRRRVFFRASADPLGTNPSENCQLFSIDTLGSDLRQLTRFREGERSLNGCASGPPPGCRVGRAVQDPVTRTVLFYSSCDPFGTNPYGSQVFAMRPDGSTLRQLTHSRGLVNNADGTVTVELPGPFAYSAKRDSSLRPE